MKYLFQASPWTQAEGFVVEDENGEIALRVEGKLFSRRQKMILSDQYSIPLGKIERKLLSIFPVYTIVRDGKKIATVSKKPSIFRSKWEVFTLEGDYLTINGNFFDYEYGIYQGRKRIALVSKKLFKWPDTYGILIPDTNPPYLFLCIAVIIDLINAAKVKP